MSERVDENERKLDLVLNKSDIQFLEDVDQVKDDLGRFGRIWCVLRGLLMRFSGF